MKKTIPYVLLLPFALIVLFTQCEKEPDPNDPVEIPDQSLIDILIEDGVDTNDDGKISYAEAEAVIKIIDYAISHRGSGIINSLEGIEAFINLEELTLPHHQITSMDFSKNTLLKLLDFQGNQVNHLNVSNCRLLERLWCGANNLTTLDISNNTSLIALFCQSNQLSSLDVSNNTSLTNLFCQSNQLSSLDVSNNTALDALVCSGNQLIILDVSNNTVLKVLACSGNQFSDLDISYNNELGNYSGEFVEVDISQMPTLYKVCVWEMPFPPEGVIVDTTGSPNIYFSTDCSK